MISVCFYFQVHQPYRLRHYSFFDIGQDNYFDDQKNREVLLKVANKCYLPMNRLLLKMAKEHKGEFRFTFSLTGTVVEQYRQWCPEVLDLFRALADTGSVEFLSETYYHSLAGIYSEKEFREQVKMHAKLMRDEFGVTPTSFRNTELIFNNHIGWVAADMGFRSIVTEGTERILGWRSPNFLYVPRYSPQIRTMLKNYRLSDDIAFRFSDRGWTEWPLTVEKFAPWVHNVAGNGNVVNLFMDYETFGEHQWEDTGIFRFMEHLPRAIWTHPDFQFRTVTEAARKHEPVGEVETDHPISWADMERDLSAWTGNSMQREALSTIYELEEPIKRIGDPRLLENWRKLLTSDHFYYMSTKFWQDGDVHKYFSPYGTPHEAYVYFMNCVADLRQRVQNAVAWQ
ncbi:glycoside hydrolase family 57 protein [Leptonema illini]|uniref:Glycoside hydrolase family 57 n=1 Tax=Leptonema illini DSM 21528 TaxID=929563 RepID=H2CDT9_9LEPT|nr:glycoside hydrolase family 57 protein [Leptonema illini]EHQ05458.1 glycoside hydrolase family 57 [Leptonema illini DSM 21528]